MTFDCIELTGAFLDTLVALVFVDAFLRGFRAANAIVATVAAVALKLFIAAAFGGGLYSTGAGTFLCGMLVAKSSKEAKAREAALAALLYLAAGGTLELMAGIVFYACGGNAHGEMNAPQNDFIIANAANLLILLLSFAVKKSKTIKLGSISMPYIIILIMFALASIMLTILVGTMAAANGYSLSFWIMAGVAALVILNAMVPAIADSLAKSSDEGRRLRDMEKQVELQKLHIAKLIKNESDFSLRSHDIKQHLQTLQSLCDCGDYEKAVELLRLISSAGTHAEKMVFTGDPSLDAILSIKKGIAESRGIKCDWFVSLPPDLFDVTFDLLAYIGNALDNAIEASDSVTGVKFIDLSLTSSNESVLCEIANAITEAPVLKGSGFVSAKEPSSLHGFGIESMRRYCENMGGEMEIRFDDSIFEVKLIVPVKTI
jgi:hypothetical protein